MENNKNKKSVKFQGVMLNFYDFIQVFVFTANHHLKYVKSKSDNRLDSLHQILSNTDTIRIFIPLDTVINDKEILNCIGKLKNNKASDLDSIKNKMIKLGTYIFLPCLNKVNI